MKLAEILRAKKEVELTAAANGIALDNAKITLYDWCKKCADENKRQQHKALPWLEKYGGKEILLSGVNPEWFERFQRHMEDDSGLAKWSSEKYVSIIRGHLKKAVRDNILNKNPSSGISHIKTPGSNKMPLAEEELNILNATPTPRCRMKSELQNDIRRGFNFSCLTGLRISDLTQLTWQNVDVYRMQVAKKQQKTQDYVYVPMNEQAWDLINDGKKHKPDEFVFPYLATTGTDTNTYLKKWAEIAGINKKVTWHIGRHTDATLLIDAGADIYTVQKLLDHKDVKTTEQYAALSDKKKRAAVNALPDLGIQKIK